jgi:hypothetical protein
VWSVVLEEGVQWEEQEPDRGYSFASREGRARVLTCGAHGQKGGSERSRARQVSSDQFPSPFLFLFSFLF